MIRALKYLALFFGVIICFAISLQFSVGEVIGEVFYKCLGAHHKHITLNNKLELNAPEGWFAQSLKRKNKSIVLYKYGSLPFHEVGISELPKDIADKADEKQCDVAAGKILFDYYLNKSRQQLNSGFNFVKKLHSGFFNNLTIEAIKQIQVHYTTYCEVRLTSKGSDRIIKLILKKLGEEGVLLTYGFDSYKENVVQERKEIAAILNSIK